jgi:ryanodine receptor 2
MTYTPKPINTSDVSLPEGIKELTEMLAKNAHEVWAAQRIKDGWSYGPVRDDVTKKHPCLLSYEELPESEKEYDRSTALETVKLILTLGYEISRK